MPVDPAKDVLAAPDPKSAAKPSLQEQIPVDAPVEAESADAPEHQVEDEQVKVSADVDEPVRVSVGPFPEVELSSKPVAVSAAHARELSVLSYVNVEGAE